MPTKTPILFLIPDGVGIKNYLYSDVVKYLKAHHNITIWSPLPKSAFHNAEQLHDIKFGYKQLSLKTENIKTRLYREATTFARLIHNTKLKQNPTIMTNWRRPNYSFKIKVLYRLAELLGRYISNNYKRILRFEAKSRTNIPEMLIQNYVKDLKALQPISIFITHQRVPGLMPICIAAKRLGIKTATVIFSWDNLPKARLSVKTDTYLVWSQWMKDEMKDYYPEIPQENVILVGTPQFEFYLDSNRISDRNIFAATYNLDAEKVWICFSGDDITTSPHDDLFLNDVLEALYIMKEKVEVIFRRCPVDFSDRYDDVLKQYADFVIPIDPIWNVQSQTGWEGFFPMYDDINMQVNLASHCAMVINLGSTMAHDFTTHGKPCLYLNYNPSEQSGWSTKIIYKFQHFRSMENLDAVGWINSKTEIKDIASKVISNSKSIAKDKEKWMQKVVLHPLHLSSKNIAKAIV